MENRMAVMNFFCINKSGQAYEVHDMDQNDKVVGKINNREAFVVAQDESDLISIKFLHSNGEFKETFIHLGRYPMPDGMITLCELYPYCEEYIDGSLYQIYKMRKTKNVYTAAANYWGQVAAGMYVASNNSKVGETHGNWKMINYVKSTRGDWVRVTGDGVQYGFVDTGLATASGYSVIPFYGSW